MVVRCAARLATSQLAAAAPPRTLSRQFSLQKPPACHFYFFPPRRVANERNVKGQWITLQIVSLTSFTPPPPISISDTLFSTSCLFFVFLRPVSSKPAVSLYTRQFLFFLFLTYYIHRKGKRIEKTHEMNRHSSACVFFWFFFGFFFPRHTFNVRRGSRIVSLLHFCL